jgi:hypothetical protein
MVGPEGVDAAAISSSYSLSEIVRTLKHGYWYDVSRTKVRTPRSMEHDPISDYLKLKTIGYGGPEGVRTLGLTVKSRLLYLAKLQAHVLAGKEGLNSFNI